MSANMVGSNHLEDLFSLEILRWRYMKALSSSFVLQSTVTALSCSLFNYVLFERIWNPFLLMSHVLNNLISFAWLLRLPMPFVCYVILTRIHIQSYTVYWWIPDKRLQYLTHILQPKKVLYSFLMITISCLLLQHYASQVDPTYSVLTMPCKDRNESTCINHPAALLILAGVMFGSRLAYKYFLNNYRVMRLSAAEPHHFVMFKGNLRIRTVMESCSLFEVGLWFLCAIISSYVLLDLSNFWDALLFLSPEKSQFSYMLSMVFDIRHLLIVVFCLVLLSYHLYCFFNMFNEFVTESIELPICYDDYQTATTQSAPDICAWKLSNAMTSSCDLLKMLAFKQMKEFSEDATPWGSFSRAQIFAISKPGGHPHSWQSILIPSLNLIRKFTERLRVINCTEERSLTEGSQTQMDSCKRIPEAVSINIKFKLIELFQGLKQYPLFCYLLSDLPDAKNRQIFSEAQSVIWAIQGLSNLVAASYTDDQFGVVQRNISDILTALTQLQQIIDKVGRGIPARRADIGISFGHNAQNYPHDMQLRRSLRLTVRSALYTVTTSFMDSIQDITLTNEVRTKLESYLTFQEG